MPIPVWQSGTLYQPGDLVKPVASGTITPQTILNAGFEDGPTSGQPPADWTILAESNGAIDAYENAPTFEGTWALDIFANENCDCRIRSDTEIACVPGDLVTFGAYVQWVTGDDPRFSWLQLSIRWFTALDVPLAPTIAYVLGTVEASGTTAFQVWALRQVSGVAPANAAYCKLEFASTTDDSDVGTWRIDSCTISFAGQGAPNPFLFRAVQAAAGFSGSTEPTWPVVLSGTVVDNEVTWEAVPANTVTWEASRILVTGATEPTPWPDMVGGSILDNTIVWQLDSRRVTDSRVPQDSSVVLAASSKIFAADDDIINFSATVNPLDWSTAEDAGYIGFGLQQYGGNPVTALGLYRGSLAAFNSEGCQLWQLDEDPAGITYLDAIPVPCTFPKTLQPVGDDLALLTNLGARSLGLSGSNVNLQGGYFGQQVDPLVLDAIAAAAAAGIEPFALYWAARGQYWLIFGDEAFVLTITGGANGKLTRSWSRYVFPEEITDWTIKGTELTLRTATDKVWVVDPDTYIDDTNDVASSFEIDLELSTFYATPSGWGSGVTSVALGSVHNYANGTPVQLFGPSKTGLFSATTVTVGAEDATAATLGIAITAAINDVAIFRYPAEGPFTPASDNVVGERDLRVTGAGVQTYLRAGTVVRITWASGTDWNYLRRDVEVGELELPLENPLEHTPTAVRLYPEGATLVNSSTPDVMYVPIPLAANVSASTAITLTRGLPANAVGVQMIACAFQQTTVAGGQATSNVTLAAATTFLNTGTTRVVFTDTAGEVWQVPSGITSIDALLVGGGAASDAWLDTGFYAGGAGGGAVTLYTGIAVTPLENLTMVPGSGGSLPGGAGVDTSILRSGSPIATSFGGLLGDSGGGSSSQDFQNAGGENSPGGTGGSTGGPGGFDGGDGVTNAGGGGGGAGGNGANASGTTGGAGGVGALPAGSWGTDIGDNGYFGAGGGGSGSATAGAQGTPGGGANGTGGGAPGTVGFSGTGNVGYDGLIAVRYGSVPTPPETGFPSFPLLIGPFALFEEGEEFEGAVQWPFLDFKNPGADKELLAFDLVITGEAYVSIGWDERAVDYDAAGPWTAEHRIDGDTLPGTPVPFSVTGPTLSFRLRFVANQAWQWDATNLYVKDLNT